MTTPHSSRPHLGIFGRRNVGKSSFINAITEQKIAIVSDTPGTTTDPVSKAAELADLGPVVLIDTAGVDDIGELGLQRVEATFKAVEKIDLAILLIGRDELTSFEFDLIERFSKRNTPYVVVRNKIDIDPLGTDFKQKLEVDLGVEVVSFSAATSSHEDVRALIELLKKSLPNSLFNNPTVLGDLVSHGDIVLLVTPIDIEAPKGRLIMPQVQTIRDALDNDCLTMIVKERELDMALRALSSPPKLVVTDSQAFLKVDASIPSNIPLTSFSILFARLKGEFETFIQGARKLGTLNDGDRILILESCTHHAHGDDIGRVKIPRWINNYAGKKLEFDVVAGLNNLPRAITDYALVIQCGGCMLTRKQVLNRIRPAIEAGIPVTNYGMAIAYVQGIFERAVAPFVSAKEDYL